MKKWLLSTLVIGAVCTSVQGAELTQPYGKLKKQIDIMGDIISTSLSGSQSQRNKRNSVSVEGVYLKAQGVVFEVNSRDSRFNVFKKFGHDSDDSDVSFEFNFSDQNTPIPPVPPIDPLVVIDDEDVKQIVINAESSLQGYEDAMEVFRERSEHARELRDEQRELAYEMRSYNRKKRDLEFEARHAQDEKGAEIKQELAELNAELAKLEAKEAELRVRADKEEQLIKLKKDQRAEQVKQAEETYFAQLDKSIAETLCNYGGGLRDLADNEFVTFVIDLNNRNYADKSKKIHSFAKKDIVACVMEKKSATELLKSAQSYYF